MSSQEKTEFFTLDDRASLICGDSSTVDAAKDTLRELGFKFHTAETPELAIERIRYTDYDCIILDENFAGSSLRSNAVLNFLNALPMRGVFHYQPCHIFCSSLKLRPCQPVLIWFYYHLCLLILPGFPNRHLASHQQDGWLGHLKDK